MPRACRSCGFANAQLTLEPSLNFRLPKSGKFSPQLKRISVRTDSVVQSLTTPASQSPQTGGPQKKNSVQRAPLGEPLLALRMCRRPAAARAASAGRPLLHDRSVLRHARIADRICRRSCLHDCTPLHAASDVSDVLSPLTVACFRRAAPPGALRRLGGGSCFGDRLLAWRFSFVSGGRYGDLSSGVLQTSRGEMEASF